MPPPAGKKRPTDPPIPGIAVVGFDCDGVMFDSAQANRAYYDAVLEHCRRGPMTDTQFDYAQMHTVDEALAHLFPDSRQQERAQSFRRTLSYLPFIRHMRIEPHLKRLLAALRPCYTTAVATNRTDTMDRVLTEHGLEGGFDLVVSALDVPRPKPHPDCLQRVLAHFEARPGQMVYIGDSPLDARAAAAAGVVFLAFGNPRLPADHHVATLAEVGTLLGVELGEI